ncbi:MAG: M20 family metallopeptidase [Clostridiales bacterium]|nr:M20 family metallopeptidase [Clostridiales bacterium]
MKNIDFMEALDGLLKIKSVAVDGDGDAPFGEGCKEALDYMLSLCAGFGFRTKKCGNMLGWAEIGEGDEMIGILAHLDVVPEGSGWEYPAFGCTVVGDRVYGRGVNDDKGPALMCVYAMKELLDSGCKLNRRIRIIFGLTEERGEWTDMKYYVETEELPTFGITPDATFPAVYGEKGILVFRMRMPLAGSGVDSISGGSAHNVVPDACEAVVGGQKFSAVGKSVHGSCPEKGENAILKLMAEVNEAAPCKLSKLVTEKFGLTCDGSLIGCALSDSESGALTLNVGVIEVIGDEVVVTVDIRYPVTYKGSDILDIIRRETTPYGVEIELDEDKAPIYKDKDSAFIRALMDVYREETGDDTEAFVMGGGTYARAMPNIVAFGPALPNSADVAHQKNEYMLVSEIELARRIYKKTLERMLTL